MHSLPLFLKIAGEPVILLGEGDAADAKRRIIERAGGVPVDEGNDRARIAFIALEDASEAESAAARFKARRLIVNVVDRPELCDFTTPAIVDRDPVLIAISTGGASSGLAAALRQRLETMIPAQLGALAAALRDAKATMRKVWPDSRERRRALGEALQPGGQIDPFGTPSVAEFLEGSSTRASSTTHVIQLRSDDPDDLSLRDSRALGQADHIIHDRAVPLAILARARADAVRIMRDDADALAEQAGLTIQLRAQSL